MYSYSPFSVDLSELKTKDLIVLKSVTEGWYVEYKREIPNVSSVAKSISAFANTHGGWLFYGIDEHSKANSVAGAFPGIARRDVDGALHRIRQAVSDHLNPPCHFETTVLWGHQADIELPEDYAIICIHVPRSVIAPMSTKAGKFIDESGMVRSPNARMIGLS